MRLCLKRKGIETVDREDEGEIRITSVVGKCNSSFGAVVVLGKVRSGEEQLEGDVTGDCERCVRMCNREFRGASVWGNHGGFDFLSESQSKGMHHFSRFRYFLEE